MSDQEARSAASPSRPRLLDLFCGAGGCSVGYERAGFQVTGVDIAPQPNYPFPFVQEDALTVLASSLQLGNFDAIHASPPCQAYSRTQRLHGREHPDLISPTRDLLRQTGLPYVIENVEDAPLEDPVTLCGSMFGLDVRRHRLFETSFPIWLVPGCQHGIYTPGRFRTHARKDKAQWSPIVHVYGTGGGAGKDINLWRRAMGTPWMQTKREIAEAIPPAYAEFVGLQLLDFLRERNHAPLVGDPGLDVVDNLLDCHVAVVGELDVEMNEDRAGHGGLLSVDAPDSPKPAPNVKDVAA